MNQPFHYKVFSRRVNRTSPDKIDFITSVKEFKNENPIISREEAFNYYQNYVEELTEALGENYSSDYQARTCLRPFLGYIGVIMVVDKKTDELPITSSLEPNEIEIHCIPTNDLGNLDLMMYSLDLEYKYYQYYSCDTKDYKRTIQFFGCPEPSYYELEEADLQTFTILETPFDWSRYTEPRSRKDDFENEFHWTGFEIAKNNLVEESETTTESPPRIPLDINLKEDVLEIISQGEGNQVEFKPTLVYNFKTETSGIGIKGIIAKAICAFLNANGGYLLIGVTDKGEIQGLSYDYKLAPVGKNPRDYFKQEFDGMISKFFSPKVRHSIKTSIVNIDKKDIFIVAAWPSQNPIFINGQINREFYIRGEASSNQITDIEEIVDYCLEHFCKKTQ